MSASQAGRGEAPARRQHGALGAARAAGPLRPRASLSRAALSRAALSRAAGRALALAGASATLSLALAAWVPAPAQASLALKEFTVNLYSEGQQLDFAEEAGQKKLEEELEHEASYRGPFKEEPGSYTLAGGHPFAAKATFIVKPSGRDEVNEAVVEFPPGFLGDPQNTPPCPIQEFEALKRCPEATAVGFIHIPAEPGESRLYNLSPPPGQAVALGFPYQATGRAGTEAAELFAHVRAASDFGITLGAKEFPRPNGEAIEVTVCDLGVLQLKDAKAEAGKTQEEIEALPKHYACSSTPPATWAAPFLENPTRCGATAETARTRGVLEREGEAAETTVYQNGPPGPEAAPGQHTYYGEAGGDGLLGAPPGAPYGPQVGECAHVSFAPTGAFAVGNAQAGQPAGDEIELLLPQPASGFFKLESGKTLTCGSGGWTGAPGFGYRWLRDGVEIEEEGSRPVSEGGTPVVSSTYRLRGADEGKAIQCEVIATNAGAAAAAFSLASARWGEFAPEPAPPTPGYEATPTISGNSGEDGRAQTGNMLLCDPHALSWSGDPAFSFQWLRNGQPIAGTTGPAQSTYSVRGEGEEDIQCVVSAQNAGGTVLAVSADAPVEPLPEVAPVPANESGHPPSFESEPVPEGRIPPLPSGLRSTTVTLPEGLVLSPSAADGLASCSPAQIGLSTPLPAAETQTPGPIHFSEAGLHEGEPRCPEASKLGTIELDIPLLAHPLQGSFYLAEPHENPFGSLFAIYLAAYDQETGVVLKLAGNVQPNPETGRLTVEFPESPQLPFSRLDLKFKEGPRAALANPRACGTYGGEQAPTFTFTPWSGQAPASLALPFTISEGCIDEASFAPIVASGTETNKAATWAPFKMSFTRSDSEQQLGRLTVVTPDLVGKLAGVTRCEEPQASTGSCPESSRIGYVEVAAGPGPAPLWEPPPGSEAPIYLTGPYEGAPFGLSIPVPAEAGPLHLGKVLMRAKVNVDPHTAALTIETDPVPHILDGVPLQVRTFNVVVNRPEFVINPTDCNPLGLSARVEGLKGALESVTEHFQATGCEALPFAPSFSAQSEAKTSRQNGASLSVRIAQRPGEANLKRIDIKVPTVMPTRLPTLQHSCPEAQFEANPAACPAESIVGHASARTRVLGVPLEGPAILVSHAGLHLPNVVVVLQGEGVTIEASSETHIIKGVLEEDFETIPDNPVESFEVSLPAGPHSILAANSSLCKPTEVVVKTKRVALKRHGKLVRRHGKLVYRKRKVKQRVASPLAMPTTIEGQNGRLIEQQTRIAVSGCRPAKGRKRNRGGRGKKDLAKRHGKSRRG